jgi:hypothetical protein
MADALRRLGRDVTRERLIAALEAMHQVDLGGYRISYGTDDRLGSRYVELTVVGSGGKVMK